MSDECKSEAEWIRSISARYNGFCSYEFASKVFYLMNKNLNRTISTINNYLNGIWRYPDLLNITHIICSGYIRLNCNNINKNDICNNKVINILNDYYTLNVKQERQEYDDIASKVKYIENDYWYPISKTWWDTWINYTQYGINENDIPGGYMYMERRSAPKPGKIDNSAIQDMSRDDPKLIKINTIQSVDYIWIHETEWNYLYGLYSGGPAFPRISYYKTNGDFTYAKTLQPYHVILIDPDSGDINKSISNVEYICPCLPFNFIAIHLMDKHGSSLKSLNTPWFRIWIQFKYLHDMFLHDFNFNRNDIRCENPNRWIEIPKNNELTLTEIETKSGKHIQSFALETIQYHNFKYYFPTQKFVHKNNWNHFRIGQIVDALKDVINYTWSEAVIKQVFWQPNMSWEYASLVIQYIDGKKTDWFIPVYNQNLHIFMVQKRGTFTKYNHILMHN